MLIISNRQSVPEPEQNALMVLDPPTNRFGELLLDPQDAGLPPQPTCNAPAGGNSAVVPRIDPRTFQAAARFGRA